MAAASRFFVEPKNTAIVAGPPCEIRRIPDHFAFMEATPALGYAQIRFFCADRGTISCQRKAAPRREILRCGAGFNICPLIGDPGFGLKAMASFRCRTPAFPVSRPHRPSTGKEKQFLSHFCRQRFILPLFDGFRRRPNARDAHGRRIPAMAAPAIH